MEGQATVTLAEPPIEQPNFVKGDTVLVVRTHQGGTQNLRGTVESAIGPSKYKIMDLA